MSRTVPTAPHNLDSHDTQAPPSGFEPYAAISPFMALWGQLYERGDTEGRRVIGVRVQTQHLNHQDAMHGGMVASLCDNAMGYLAAKCLGGPIATVHLAVDYLARVPVGAWLEVHSRLDEQDKNLLFTACEGRVEGGLAFRATAVFSAIRR